jgi:hypothetical protein
MRFKMLLVAIMALCFAVCMAPQTLNAQQTMNNDAVIKLVKAGLSEDLIVSTINSQPGTYNTTTDGLIALKKAGVSDKVVGAIVTKGFAPAATTIVVQTPGIPGIAKDNPSGATPGTGQNAVGDPNDPLAAHDSGIYVYTTDRNGKATMVVLERTAYQGAKTGGMFASAMTYGIAKVKMTAVIPGKKAMMRVDTVRPVFYFYFDDKAAGLGTSSLFGNVSNPNQFALINLKIEKSSRTTEIGDFSMWGGSSGSNEKSMVAFKSERIRPGLYKITLVDDLKAGEYCFIASTGVTSAYAAGATTAHDLFDFGVDTQ